MTIFPFKRTKILATVGPAVNNPEKITELIKAGVNGFRCNFSHGTAEERLDQIKWIREASEKAGRPVSILQDLQGPKIRLGMLSVDRIDVKKDEEYILDSAAEHSGNVLPSQYNLAEKVRPGEPIYLFDGKIKATVVDVVSETAIKIKLENDGFLMSRKAINLPDTDFGGDILTPKDIADIEFGAGQDFDYVALSFVQSDQDIHDLRQLLLGHGSKAHIVAKIETKAAIQPEMLERIVKASDGVMVARGDLAVEAGAEIVPIVQRQIIALCRKYGKLSIVATQMMASMVDAPEPTRAEVSDVANAVIQGSDVVMLSDETANGSYPIETVTAMRKVILYTQEHAPVVDIVSDAVLASEIQTRDAISHAAVQLARQINADVIIAETRTGGTAENIATCRPDQPILSVTSEITTAQHLALSYANRSYVRPDDEHSGELLLRELKDAGFFGELSPVRAVIVSGGQPGLSGATDTIRVRVVE